MPAFSKLRLDSFVFKPRWDCFGDILEMPYWWFSLTITKSPKSITILYIDRRKRFSPVFCARAAPLHYTPSYKKPLLICRLGISAQVWRFINILNRGCQSCFHGDLQKCFCCDKSAATKAPHALSQVLLLQQKRFCFAMAYIGVGVMGRTPSRDMISPTRKGMGKKRTTPIEFRLMIEWLQNKSNFSLITGSAAVGNQVVCGQPLKKTDAYRLLSEFINKNIQDRDRIWTVEITKSRYESFITKYKEALKFLDPNRTGDGITNSDRKRGINTIEEKYESKCPHFARGDALFGDRQNVNPKVVLEVGARPVAKEVQDASICQVRLLFVKKRTIWQFFSGNWRNYSSRKKSWFTEPIDCSFSWYLLWWQLCKFFCFIFFHDKSCTAEKNCNTETNTDRTCCNKYLEN